MQIERVGMYRLRSDGESFFAASAEGIAFEPVRYSLLKYGSAAASESWAAQLAQLMLARLPQVCLASQPPVVTASAYHEVPTAAFAVAHSTRARINRERTARQLPELDAGRIYRHSIYEGEYERLSADQRRDVLAAMQLSYQGPALDGRVVCVIDDIRVSGSHEAVLTQLLAAHRPAAIYFIYLVEADEAQGHADPALEQRLNNSAIGSLEALRELLTSEPTLLNARVVKRILLWPRSPDQLDGLLSELPDGLLSRLYKAALADGHHRLPSLQGAFARLEAILQERLIDDFSRIRVSGDDPAFDLARLRAAQGV